MKVLCIGDLHEGVIPECRLDDFELTRFLKTKEILEIAKENEVTAILQPGDFLNKANISSELLNGIMKKWVSVHKLSSLYDVMLGIKDFSELEKELKNVIPMIGSIGNHELIGGEIGSFSKTSLCSLYESGFMQIATKDKPVILKDKSGFSVAITSAPYTHNIDDDDKSAYIVDEKLGDYHIHLAHGLLMPKSYGKKFKHTVVSEIAYDTKADLTINGHDHIGYDLMEVDNKLFVNPGSPFRLTADKKEIARMPKVLLIEIDKATGITVTPIYLKSAKPGEEVITREHIIASKAKAKKIEEVESAINKAKINKGVDITEIINNLGKTEGLDSKLVDEVIASIIDSMKKLKPPFNPKGSYIIERLELVNFMSHKNSVFEFSEGLNVLAGCSRNGKSAVLRSIKELSECYLKNPRDYIFLDENEFRITAYLSNGYVITRVVERKKTGKNGYEVYDPITGEVSVYNTKGVTQVQEILGLNKIILSEKTKININFSMQGEGWFCLGNNLSAPDKAKLVGAMYGTQYADAVLKDINSKAKKIVAELNVYDKDINNLKKEADKYLYLDELEKVYKEAESLYSEIDELNSDIEEIENLIKEKEHISKEISLLEKYLSKLTENEAEIKQLYTEIKEDDSEIECIRKIISEIDTIVKAGKEARYVANSLSNYKEASDLLEEIKLLDVEISTKSDLIKINKELNYLTKLTDSLKDIETVKDIFEEIKSLNEEIQQETELIEKAKSIQDKQTNILLEVKQTEQILNSYQHLDEVKNMLDEIKVLNKDIDLANNLINDINSINSDIALGKEEVKEQKSLIKNYLKGYKVELEKMGECPVCHGTIDRAVINNLISKLSKETK